MFKKILFLTIPLLSSTIVLSDNTQITLDWPTVKSADYYKLYRSASLKSPKFTNNILPKKWNKSDFIDKGIKEDTQYYYWLKNCQTGVSCSKLTPLIAVYIPSLITVMPPKPKVVVRKKVIVPPVVKIKEVPAKKMPVIVAKPKPKPKPKPKSTQKHNVTLDWSNIKANYYKINRGTGDFGQWGKSILPSGFTGTQFIDKGLKENTRYNYWIKTCETRNDCSGFTALVGVTII
jgi:hypothetical protein